MEVSLAQRCRDNFQQGCHNYEQSCFDKACFYFKQASAAAKRLCIKFHDRQGIKLWVMANHNAAASYNHAKLIPKATAILEHNHGFLMDISQDESLRRELRIEALGFLQQTLFSLATQYAYLGQNHSVYRVIFDTERQVLGLSQHLLDDETQEALA